MDDRSLVSWQLGRPSRPFVRVAVRCPHGYPAVTEQAPVDGDGIPFPTTFYLTCPWLVAAIARLEAAGGVVRWTRAVDDDVELRASRDAGFAEQRRLRPQHPGGIAGTPAGGGLKCLHAHAAFALARPGYLLGERILAEVPEQWCSDGRCAAGGCTAA